MEAAGSHSWEQSLAHALAENLSGESWEAKVEEQEAGKLAVLT